MEALMVGLLVMLLMAGGAALFLISQAALRRDLQQGIGSANELTQQRIEGLDLRLGQRLDGIQETVNRSLTSTTDTIGKIGEQLGALGKSAEQILDVGKDISALQDILQPPKLRGGLGEMLMERLLAQVVPGAFTTQYRFRGGETVDAVIRLGAGLVPIDSKFPVESFTRLQCAETEEERRTLRREFERTVRGHVDAVARYIRADEGTLDFALMYIPAENVYYALTAWDLESGGGVFAYAQAKRVFAVSPGTFYAYLASISLGLRGLKVEERARELFDHLARLNVEFERFRRDFGVLGGHIEDAKKKYDALNVQTERFGGRLARPLEAELSGDGEEGARELPGAQAGADLRDGSSS